tara:strand:- start:1927 stop:3000 length:1074 start_codon:yes stop_codon:yes gene_type:complete
MAAELIGENASENVKDGFVELAVTQVWQVILANRTDTFETALLAAGLPALGSAGTFGTATLYVISRVPARVDDDSTGRKWNVTVGYSNNTQNFARNDQGEPVTDPTSAAKSVDIQYLEYSEPITDATFDSVTEGGGYSVGTALTSPSWLDDGDICVSTGESILAERTAYRQVITVSRLESSWTSTYEDYQNTINNASLTITETDSTGTVATYTFPAQTLRMKPITKQPVWIDSELFFRISFPMEHKADTWIHAEADRSQSERVFYGPPAQIKPGGGDWTEAEIDALNPQAAPGTVKWTLLTMSIQNESGDTIAVGDSRPLNGNGARLGVDATSNVNGKSCYVNWKIFEEKNFSTLNL